MIIKIKHNLITGTYYVYRSGTSTVQLRKNITKSMLPFMGKAKIKTEGDFVIYLRI